MAAQVGLDPREDIDWVTSRRWDFHGVVRRGEVDAFLGFPPEPQELRARRIGRVILSTTHDKPWSQYFCCTAGGSRTSSATIRSRPSATLRAILKAADICANEPERAAQRLVDARLRAALRLRAPDAERDPLRPMARVRLEDSLRFFALRLHEVGMIKSSPNELIAEGTDWRFLNELKRELKA